MNNSFKRFLVTGGAGFIGSSFIRVGMEKIPFCERIVNLDNLSYAADLRNLDAVKEDPRYVFVKGDIRDQALVEKICIEEKIDAIVHFAAETHVDRSIETPLAFYETNVGGTIALLEVLRRHPHIHLHHISTDEVYGSLSEVGIFSENSPYSPNSPYSASKAASDHFVRAYAHTYGLATTISHCTNNYGPCQYPEKLIPRMIAGCVHRHTLPIYGQGINVRDWIFVDDHSSAVWTILERGVRGETYGIGGGCEMRNLDLVHLLVGRYAAFKQEDPEKVRSLIAFVEDRPGHDLRYAMDCEKIRRELGWSPMNDFSSGIDQTINWYLHHPERLVLV